jgi:hypothetical protein
VIALNYYHEPGGDITWENSTMRTWLNNDFLKSLPSGVRGRIAETQVRNEDNADYKTPGGNDTMDKVFLLSINEANRYFSNNEARSANYNVNGFTDYNNKTKTYVDRNGDSGFWWLRSPGAAAGAAAFVSSGGMVFRHGGPNVDRSDVGVRPAFWINL